MTARSATTDRAVLYIIGALVVVLVGGFVALSIAGRSTDSYVTFASGPAVGAVVVWFQQRKASALDARLAAAERTRLLIAEGKIPRQAEPPPPLPTGVRRSQ